MDKLMAQTQEYERRERDWYPTPAWCVDALNDFHNLEGEVVLEPASGDGAMVDALKNNGAIVHAQDIHPLRDDIEQADWFDRTDCCYSELSFKPMHKEILRYDWVITNPPYDQAEAFIRHAKEISNSKTVFAFLLRNEFDCAKRRHDLFSDHNWFMRKIVLTKRPYWTDERKASPRHNYAWYLFNTCWAGSFERTPEISYWKEK